MSGYDNTNSGIIGKNDRKAQDSHPDITGSINVEGLEYFLDGWKKDRKDGTGSFYSLKVKRKDKQPEVRPTAGQTQERQGGSYAAQSGAGANVRGNDLDDEVPF